MWVAKELSQTVTNVYLEVWVLGLVGSMKSTDEELKSAQHANGKFLDTMFLKINLDFKLPLI